MASRPCRVLFVCTGNSARSILAECLLNRLGGGRFVAASAGSHPKGAVHPQATALLTELGYETAGLSSKSWAVFTGPGVPLLDLVITLCDAAAGESCPIWPGTPVTAHWGIPDPAAAEAVAAPAAFRHAYRQLEGPVRRLAALDPAALGKAEFAARVRAIARMGEETVDADH